ncbi:ribosomal protein L11 methyltransferase [Lachnospiraceae bacterium A10]|jgi:ribosomal protein L11 methyltransferase|nr:ribosomal protein L11 methyltransferase [Lachnospiraceae bacterium A10]
MKWMKFTIDTTEEAEDLVTATLSELGIDAVEIEDLMPVDDSEREGGHFEELQPDLPEDDGSSRINFYLEEGQEYSELLSELGNELEKLRNIVDLGKGEIRISETEDTDWRDNWKSFFHSFEIENVLIKPTWEAVETREDQIVVEIDPGVAFGTGKHETTQLCIRQMQKYLKDGDEVFDVGCGSGILSIIALKMGAAHTVGTDIDDDCIASTAANFEVNHLEQSLGDFYVGNLTDDKALQDQVGYDKYDVIVSNILADIIIGMAEQLKNALKPGGYLITSGIINFKEEEVKAALEAAGLRVVEINVQGEWVNITATK